MGKLSRIVLLLVSLFGGMKNAFAQPANDDCLNATVIPIALGGFGLGLVASPQSDLTLATFQFGEPFYSSQITAGTDKKTVWYKFTLATNRGVNLELKQPGNLIALNAAGFTLFKTSTCMPTLADITPARLTPLNQFGSSFNPCLNAGDYYVQVSARLTSNGPIFLELTTTYPGVLNDFDLKSTRHNFGTISGGWNQVTYDVGCQTIDDASETCPALGPNFLNYNQSTWMTFTTDSYVDLIRLEMGEMLNTGNYRVGYNLYQGNCFTTPNGLTLVDGCQVLQQNSFITGNAQYYWPGKSYGCTFLPNTTYSIQIFYERNYVNTVGVRLYEIGQGPTDAPIPTALGSAPGSTNALGTLPQSPAGITTSGTDFLACNAQIINNTCGSVNPASGIVTSVAATGNFRLNTWYTFTIAQSANITINTTSGYQLKRLYAGNVFSNCGLTAPIEFMTTSYEYNCILPGTYSIQILGKMDTTGRNPFDASLSQLAATANISINVRTQQANNIYNLTASTLALAQPRVYKYNAFAPLVNGISYTALPDTIGCLTTVLPAGPTCVGGTNPRAIYREITIGANGILTLSGGNYYFRYLLFRGDAQALANAQNVFSVGQTITGLQDMAGCQDLYWSNPRVCVTPGVYTLVSYGNDSHIGYRDLPTVRFDLATTLFANPLAPNNMGTIAVFPVSGTIDTWSCIDNPLTIDGFVPCSGATKQIYREFFIATPRYLNITSSNAFHLFYGQVSAGTAVTNVPNYGNLGCTTGVYADVNACTPRLFPAGWYTVVSYGSGGIYAGPNYINGNILQTNNISIYLTAPPVIPAPIYNRPYKAYVANGGLPTVWGPNAGTAAIPLTSRTYTFGTERFNCQNDLPFSAHPVNSCRVVDNRVAYFVFTLSQESYVNFMDIPNSMISKIYNLDVRTSDSLLMPTAAPTQACITTFTNYYDNLYWYGNIELCKMQPGTYTLVVFANDVHINTTLTPRLYIDKVEFSRFDHANNAYDFDNMPGDNIMRFGKIGDVNPLNAGRAASNDFFTCTTGAQPTDPANFCWDGLYQNGATNATVPYPMPNNTQHYTTTTTPPIRRNLWYTFTVTGPGRVSVDVNNLTPGSLTQYPYSIYKSNVNGTTPFAAVVAGGQVDSTFLQGLTLVSTTNGQPDYGNSNISWWGCSSNDVRREFFRDQCSGIVTDRYYIIVDHHSHIELNNQAQVGVKFESFPVYPLLYDHYYQANVINGLNQTVGPYTPITLNNGTYNGSTDNFSCATRDVPDPNTCGQKTLWWKITVGATGKIKINATTTAGSITNTFWNAANVQLYRELIPGDSTLTGLMPIALTAITNGGLPWGEACMNPGVYYILLTGCNYTIENVFPTVMLTAQSGDFCSDPVPLSVVGAGSANASVIVDCHTMAPDYGEDGSNMGCLFGPAGYKSTWYKVTVNATLKMDVSFQLSETTTAFPNQIRYRVLFGTCGAMTAGPCNTDALTQFTLNCMPIGITDYYVQIVTPIGTTGPINLAVTTVISPDQTCVPVNPTIPVSNFTVGPACDGFAVQFANQSTLGGSMTYLWNFGCCAGASSTAFAPSFTYPTTNTTTTYNVTLTATNTALNTSSFITIPVTIYPKPVCNITRDAPYAGATISAGVGINFHANATNIIPLPATSYLWDFGNGQTSTSSDPSGIIYNSYGTFTVLLTITNGTCVNTCTETVTVVSEPVFGGGINDGAAFVAVIGCPIENIFGGGINDGAGFMNVAGCIVDNIFGGGINDGAGFMNVAGCIVDNIFGGGINDGAGFVDVIGCIIENVFIGGINDGAGLTVAIGCVVQNIFGGGSYDGASNVRIIRDPLNCLVILPVSLLNFNAICENIEGSSLAQLYWATASESNNNFFTVERSNDGSAWFEIGQVSGAGNSSSLLAYQLIDPSRVSEITYYRLKQTDYNGDFTYSLVRTLDNCLDEINGVDLYPNPTNGSINIEIYSELNQSDEVTLEIYNYLGQLIAKESIEIKKGLNYSQFDLATYQFGVYNFVFKKQSDAKVILKRVVKF